MLLYQPIEGYCYNSDSLFLYDFISHLKPKGNLLDVGAGSGVLGLLVARDFPSICLEAVEKHPSFASYCEQNARVNKIECKLHECDFLELEGERRFDYIISNPPFYHDGVQRSQDSLLLSARYSLNLPMEPFFGKVAKMLKPNAHFVFCYDPSQFALLCHELAKVKMRVVDVRFVHPKKEKKASLVMIHARNNSKAMMRVLPPLFAFEKELFSEEAQRIYKRAATQSIKCAL